MKLLPRRDRDEMQQLLRAQAELKAGETDVVRAFLALPSTVGILRCVEFGGANLVAVVVKDRDSAVAAGVLAHRAAHTAATLRRIADLTERAAGRVRLALTARQDVDAVHADIEARLGPRS